MTLPDRAEDILRRGTLCYLAAITPRGPHVTPVVFAVQDGRLWATTSRRAVKTRAWRRQPIAAGLVGGDGGWVTFRGPVETYDLLDPATWRAGLQRAGTLVRASVGFTIKNARFFAGYARDARHVPLAWTPPGRVTVGVLPESGAVLDDGDVVERWGTWGRRAGSVRRLSTETERALVAPDDVDLDGDGTGVVGLIGSVRPVVLPARWIRNDRLGVYDITIPRPLATLAGAAGRTSAALVIDRTSRWRAAEMRGLLVQGAAETNLPAGAAEATIRIRPHRLVWWRGWASGSVER